MALIKTSEEPSGSDRRQTVKRVRANLGDHPLEDVTVADGLEDLVGDPLRDALQTALHEGLPLEDRGRGQLEVRRRSAGGQQEAEPAHLRVEAGGGLQEELADLVHPVGVAGGVLQAGEEAAAHRHGAVQASSHLTCTQVRAEPKMADG